MASLWFTIKTDSFTTYNMHTENENSNWLFLKSFPYELWGVCFHFFEAILASGNFLIERRISGKRRFSNPLPPN